MRNALFAHPVQRAIAAVINMNNNLMRISGILADAAHAQLQQREIIPSRDKDRKHSVRSGNLGVQQVLHSRKFSGIVPR